MKIGTPIYAPEDGELLKAVFNSARGNTGIFNFKHGGEWGAEFCHLRELPKIGMFKRGDTIAYSGNTGLSTGPHLHIVMHKDCLVTKNYRELTSEEAFFRLRDEGRLVDPFAWFTSHMK